MPTDHLTTHLGHVSTVMTPVLTGHFATPVPALDINPVHWLGAAAAVAASEVWRDAMIYLWSAGLWVLTMAFSLVDLFTTPDLSETGILATILPVTGGIAACLILALGVVQLTVSLIRRDGRPLAALLLGLVQFGVVWAGYVTAVAALVAGVSGLTRYLLDSLLHVQSFTGYAATGAFPRDVTDGTVATVLGLLTLFVIFPAAIGHLIVMLTRAAALLVMVATSPITAAGLVAEATSRWFWVMNRWILSAMFIPPLMALVLGVGVQLTGAVTAGMTTSPAGGPTGAGAAPAADSAAAIGAALLGCIVIGLAAVCPLALFRLLAFVDPGTTSGAAMRTSLRASGGWRGATPGTPGAATATGADGQPQGELSAAAAIASRFDSVPTALGSVTRGVMGGLQSSLNQGSDALTQAAVGHQQYSFGQPPPPPARRSSTPPFTGAPLDDGTPPPAAGGDPYPAPPGPTAGATPFAPSAGGAPAGGTTSAGAAAGDATSAAATAQTAARIAPLL